MVLLFQFDDSEKVTFWILLIVCQEWKFLEDQSAENAEVEDVLLIVVFLCIHSQVQVIAFSKKEAMQCRMMLFMEQQTHPRSVNSPWKVVQCHVLLFSQNIFRWSPLTTLIEDMSEYFRRRLSTARTVKTFWRSSYHVASQVTNYRQSFSCIPYIQLMFLSWCFP